MNEKSKERMKMQQSKIVEYLSDTFKLPVFQDELSESEIPSDYNYLVVVFGNMRQGKTENQLLQEIYVVWTSENNSEVEETSIDIISTVSQVPAINFKRSLKQRLQKDDVDEYVDQVTFIFERLIKYECKI